MKHFHDQGIGVTLRYLALLLLLPLLLVGCQVSLPGTNNTSGPGNNTATPQAPAIHTMPPPTDSGLTAYGARKGEILVFDADTGVLAWRYTDLQGTPFYFRLFKLNDKLYADSAANMIFVFDPASGEILEQITIEAPQNVTAWLELIDQELFAFGIEGGGSHFYAFDTATGQIRWQFQANKEIVFGKTLISGGVLYFQTEDTLYALNPRTSETLWRFPMAGKFHTLPTITETAVYVGSDEGRLYALEKSTGKLLWQYTAPRGFTYQPVADNTSVYAGTDDGTVYALDVQTGQPRWHTATGPGIYQPLHLLNETLYVQSGEGQLVALQGESGKILWRFETTAGDIAKIVTFPEMHQGDTHENESVYIDVRLKPDRDTGNFYALNAQTGEQRWKILLTDEPKLISNTANILYLGTNKGNIYALDPASGGMHWKHIGVEGIEYVDTISSLIIAE